MLVTRRIPRESLLQAKFFKDSQQAIYRSVERRADCQQSSAAAAQPNANP